MVDVPVEEVCVLLSLVVVLVDKVDAVFPLFELTVEVVIHTVVAQSIVTVSVKVMVVVLE